MNDTFEKESKKTAEDKTSSANTLRDMLLKHWGHDVVITVYGDPNDPDDVCLECEYCGEVILDSEIYTICAKEDW